MLIQDLRVPQLETMLLFDGVFQYGRVLLHPLDLVLDRGAVTVRTTPQLIQLLPLAPMFAESGFKMLSRESCRDLSGIHSKFSENLPFRIRNTNASFLAKAKHTTDLFLVCSHIHLQLLSRLT